MIKIGHRGAMGYAPENTLKSLELALDMNVPMVEIDVTLCATGEAVVIHDDRVDRTTDGKGYVKEMTLNALKKLDAGEGERIPTLQEVFDCLYEKCDLNIELKNADAVYEVSRLIDVQLQSGRWRKDQLLISSFDHEALKLFQAMQPDIRIAVLIGIIPLNLSAIMEGLDAFALNPCLDFISERLINEAKSLGLKVYVWTVNHNEDIMRMKKLGADGVFTNYPDRL